MNLYLFVIARSEATWRSIYLLLFVDRRSRQASFAMTNMSLLAGAK